VHQRVIIITSCSRRFADYPTYHLPRQCVAGGTGRGGYQDDDDDEAGQYGPAATAVVAAAAAATAAGQSQGGGKCAHRPRGASQPPKPTTNGASTSFPRRLPFSPPSRPP